MKKIPKFTLYGANDPEIEENLQPQLAFRRWEQLKHEEKVIAFDELLNRDWLDEYSINALQTIGYLNHTYLRQCPGKRLHRSRTKRGDDYIYGEDFDRLNDAFEDFKDIFLKGKSGDMVLRMLSVFSAQHIEKDELKWAENAESEEERNELITEAYGKFDRLANCLNHIFEQFSINVLVTRIGFVPRQDKKIETEIYEPTLKILSDPKWMSVSADLAQMFTDYGEKNYSEVITKAHSAVQRFLQILVGEEGKSGKGELGKLFGKAKKAGVISASRFTEPIINVFQGFIASERATKSTAKPTLKDAEASDALLVMNVVMVFLQHCLQNTK